MTLEQVLLIDVEVTRLAGSPVPKPSKDSDGSEASLRAYR